MSTLGPLDFQATSQCFRVFQFSEAYQIEIYSSKEFNRLHQVNRLSHGFFLSLPMSSANSTVMKSCYYFGRIMFMCYEIFKAWNKANVLKQSMPANKCLFFETDNIFVFVKSFFSSLNWSFTVFGVLDESNVPKYALRTKYSILEIYIIM